MYALENILLDDSKKPVLEKTAINLTPNYIAYRLQKILLEKWWCEHYIYYFEYPEIAPNIKCHVI